LNLSSKIDGLLDVMLEVVDCGILAPWPSFAELALIALVVRLEVTMYNSEGMV
jgi:hypothetical protein